MKQAIELNLSSSQAEQLAEQLLAGLSPSAKIRLVRRYEQETWPLRLRQLLSEVGQRVRQSPEAARRALRDIEPGRRAFYAARRRRH